MDFWIIFVTFLILAIYFANKHYFSYWLNRDIPQKEPTFLVGALVEVLNGKQCFGEFIQKIYQKFKNQSLVGFYFSYRPALVVNDPILVQDVMIKSFNSFHDRNQSVDDETDPLTKHLFRMVGQEWKDLRAKITPTFTTGKLKGMFPTIRDCAQVLQKYLEKNVKDGKTIYNSRDLMARFTTNVISSVAFGIDNDALNEPDNIFRKMGARVFQSTFMENVINALFFFVPNLFKTLRLKVKRVDHDLEDFFMSIVRDTIEFREKNRDFERKDFMQLLIKLKNDGFLSADKDDEHTDNLDDKRVDGCNKKLTFNEVAAQTFLFFAAGFETSSSTSSYCLFELARNPQIQTKVQQEIDKVLELSDSTEITYEMLNEMKYLDCCIDETLRKYPILPTLSRECTRDHNFAGTKYAIEKGTTVFIPVLGLHRDPDIYENPLEFKPERFLDSTNGNGNSKGLFYLPFGDGPRNCIGARMGKIQTKLGLAVILSKFTVELADEALKHKELEFYEKTLLFLLTKDDIKLKIKPRF